MENEIKMRACPTAQKKESGVQVAVWWRLVNYDW